MASSERWASGAWLVRGGSEDEFVNRWKAWLSWTSENAPGFRSAMLIRSEEDGRRFESFSDWDDAQSRAQWEGSDGFRERIGPVRELCDDVQAGNFQLSASFPST
jgi:heme-degrading monooxygenase HmoA